MSKGLFRVGFLGLPVLAASFAIIAACSSDDETGGTTNPPDAAQTPVDGSIPRVDGSIDPPADGGPGLDAADAADQFVPPALCVLYPNNAADASVAEGPRKLYELIALRALLEAADSCEIGSGVPAVDLENPPSQITCFGLQLASLSGCLVGGAPINYAVAEDENAAKCIAAVAGDDTVKVGLRNTGGAGFTFSNRDVDFLIALTKKAAISTGMKAEDAERLRVLLAAQRATATVAGGGAGDGGTYTQSTCP